MIIISMVLLSVIVFTIVQVEIFIFVGPLLNEIPFKLALTQYGIFKYHASTLSVSFSHDTFINSIFILHETR